VSAGHHQVDRDAASRGDRSAATSRLGLALALAASYMVAEAVGGWITNSLALLADAGHMLSDVAALAISLAALKAASRPPTASRTYGFHRAEVLAALANAVTLCVVAVFIAWEAAHRFSAPPEIDAGTAFFIATGGLLVNIAGLFVLGGHHEKSIGVRSAWLHMVGDALGSIGAMTSAATIAYVGWRWMDPLASLLIALLIVRSGTALLLETVGVLMEGSPAHIDVEEVRRALRELPGVDGVHDLHVWTITSGRESLSGHLVIDGSTDAREILVVARALLCERFGLTHVTIQVEDADFEEEPACP
jgi:cobalt-zinc-cadmium efflux system protein